MNFLESWIAIHDLSILIYSSNKHQLNFLYSGNENRCILIINLNLLQKLYYWLKYFNSCDLYKVEFDIHDISDTSIKTWNNFIKKFHKYLIQLWFTTSKCRIFTKKHTFHMRVFYDLFSIVVFSISK